MPNFLLYLLICLILLSACGKKSNIKTEVQAHSLPDVMSLVVPLSEEEMGSFDSPVEKIGFIAGGFAKMFMNLGASLGVGNKLRFTLVQQVPNLPADYLRHIKIKRVFFYIEPAEGEVRERSWIRRKFFGQENVYFDFLGKLAIKVSSHHVENVESWKPTFETKTIGEREFTPMERLFDRRSEVLEEKFSRIDDDELVLLKYSKVNKQVDLTNESRGKTYIIYSRDPRGTRNFFLQNPKLQGYFKRIHILNKSLLVELVKDPVVEEGFNVVLSENADKLDSLGIEMLDACTPMTCLDFKLSDKNLLSVIEKDNAIRLDGYVEVKKVPASFKLKGFVEFEIKTKLPF